MFWCVLAVFGGVVCVPTHHPFKRGKIQIMLLVQFFFGGGWCFYMAEISSPTVIHPKLTLRYLFSSKYSDLTENIPWKSQEKIADPLPDIKLAGFFSSITTCNGEVANFRSGIVRCGFADYVCPTILVMVDSYGGRNFLFARYSFTISTRWIFIEVMLKWRF